MSSHLLLVLMGGFLAFDLVMTYHSASNGNAGLATWYAILACLLAAAISLTLGGN